VTYRGQVKNSLKKQKDFLCKNVIAVYVCTNVNVTASVKIDLLSWDPAIFMQLDDVDEK